GGGGGGGGWGGGGGGGPPGRLCGPKAVTAPPRPSSRGPAPGGRYRPLPRGLGRRPPGCASRRARIRLTQQLPELFLCERAAGPSVTTITQSGRGLLTPATYWGGPTGRKPPQTTGEDPCLPHQPGDVQGRSE